MGHQVFVYYLKNIKYDECYITLLTLTHIIEYWFYRYNDRSHSPSSTRCFKITSCVRHELGCKQGLPSQLSNMYLKQVVTMVNFNIEPLQLKHNQLWIIRLAVQHKCTTWSLVQFRILGLNLALLYKFCVDIRRINASFWTMIQHSCQMLLIEFWHFR